MTENRARLTEVRIEPGGDGIGRAVGYAIVYDSWSEDLGGFREIIKPGAATRALTTEDHDVVALFNHDMNWLLGRESNQTLRLTEDDRGVRYAIDLPDTNSGRDVLAYLKRRDVVGSSFSFNVASGGQSWETVEGRRQRTITNFDRIFDVGPVMSPAYKATNAGAERCIPRDLEQRERNLERLTAALGRKV